FHVTGVQTCALPISPERDAGLRGAALEKDHAGILRATGRSLPLDRAQSASGVRSTEPQEMAEPWLPRPDGLPPRLDVVAQSGLEIGRASCRGSGAMR